MEKEKSLDEFKGKAIYFKTQEDKKDKVGTIKNIERLDILNFRYLIEIECNKKEYKMGIKDIEQLEKSIQVAEEILTKRREQLESFFVKGKDKKVIKALKKIKKKEKSERK